MILEKLKILEENNLIDAVARQHVINAGELLIRENVIDQLNDGEVFLTHLAMSFSREEDLNKVDEDINQQLVANSHYSEVVNLWNKIQEELAISLNPEEDDYMYMHLLALME